MAELVLADLKTFHVRNNSVIVERRGSPTTPTTGVIGTKSFKGDYYVTSVHVLLDGPKTEEEM